METESVLFLVSLVMNILSPILGQSSNVGFLMIYYNRGEFISHHCGDTALFRNITQIDIDPLGRRDYNPCYCSLRTTYSSVSNIDIEIESNQYNIDTYPELDIRFLRRDGEADTTPGEIRVTNTDPTDVMSLPARIRTSPVGTYLDMICSDDGNQEFTVEQLTGSNPIPDDPKDQNGDDKNNNTIIIIIVVIIITFVIIALIIGFFCWKSKHQQRRKTQNEKYNTPLAEVTSSPETRNNKTGHNKTGNDVINTSSLEMVEYDDEGGVSYADIDPKSLAKCDPEKVAREEEMRRRNEGQVEYTEVAF